MSLSINFKMSYIENDVLNISFRFKFSGHMSYNIIYIAT